MADRVVVQGMDDQSPGSDPTAQSSTSSTVRMRIGECWGYRARRQDSLVCVEVLKIGTKRPARVLIRFVDERFEGRQEWVPPARLKVPWNGAEQWLAAELRWLAVVETSASATGSLEHRAAEMVFDRPNKACDFIDQMDAYRHAVLTVTDPAVFTAKLGFAAAELVGATGYVLDDGTVVAPWPALLAAARRFAPIDADAVLAEMDREDDRAEREATYGLWTRGRGSEGHHISAEICAEVDAKYRPVRDLVRQWCGAEARDRRDEMKALRAEVIRLGGLVEAAIGLLRQAGCDRAAATLERDLGIPVEVLRQARQSQ
jgi:hypothetical protein